MGNVPTNKSNLKKSMSITGIIFLIPAAVFLIYADYVPFAWNFILSFQQWDGYQKMKWVGIDNYKRAFGDKLVGSSLYNSVYLALFSTFFAVVLGVILAMLVYKITKKEGAIYRLILFMPGMMPLAVVALLFTFLYNPEMGLINNLLKLIGLGSLKTAWLENKHTIMICIAMVNIWRMTGLTMILCYSSMQMIPASLFESSKLDGASYKTQVFSIILPLIKPIIQLATIFILAANFKTYDTVAVMTGGGPGNISKTIPIYMVDTAFTNSEFGYAATMGVILTVIILIIIALTNKFMGGEQYEF